ncbi:tyrosine-type recombinase/integrase [Variovorax paradoxus]|nr:phage integrase family protein [Variovorax paradoxus]MBT2304536.1 tyrosine-type recombinase/integrase [Variovorax paradoxus]
MKSKPSRKVTPDGFPGPAALACLRAWHAGLSSREAVEQYLGASKVAGQSSRAMVTAIRKELAQFARTRQRPDLARLFELPATDRVRHARKVADAVETLASLPRSSPSVTDEIDGWLAPRAVRALRAHGIRTLADLTVRVPRRRRWWASIPGLGASGAREIEAFFDSHPELTERARALVRLDTRGDVVPLEELLVPAEVDGSRGTFRGPIETCTLAARNDYEAVNVWLSLHEAPATQRAYRKEVERLILWAVLERGRALSSLTAEDAVAYRAFLRRPSPRSRWVGPARPRTASDWRPFAGDLSARSVAYALSVAGALFRWLIQQRYSLANPFAGLKVRGADRSQGQAVMRVFSEGEWATMQSIAEGLEWSYGWEAHAAQRLRFVLDFAYATGLRISELVSATLGQIEVDGHGDHWLHLRGKGDRHAKVALPSMARGALDRYLMQRQLPITPSKWEPATALIGSIEGDETAMGSKSGISAARLWHVMKRFFMQVAQVIEQENPATAEKLKRASPHWMRHTHATHALARGAELTTVRDNLRHASIQTTSIYLHGDEVKRARQMEGAFGATR